MEIIFLEKDGFGETVYPHMPPELFSYSFLPGKKLQRKSPIFESLQGAHERSLFPN